MIGYVYPPGRTGVLKEMYKKTTNYDMSVVFVVYHFCNPVFYGSSDECANYCGVGTDGIYRAEKRRSKVQSKYYIEKMERYEAEELFKREMEDRSGT